MDNRSTISGFTFIKHGILLGYPIKESIDSISPLCDEVIINVGFDGPDLTTDDGTYQYLRDCFPQSKYKFLKSYWDPLLTTKGLILSQQTNIALQKCSGKYCQYIQGDEVIHENDLQIISSSLGQMERNMEIEGLVFKFIHFHGNVNVVKHTRNIYRREVRLIRNGLGIKSWLDAQGFKNQNNGKVHCIPTDARIFHYGWARQEQVMSHKIGKMMELYYGPDCQKNHFNYQRIWGLHPFTESHPKNMKEWIDNNKNDLDILNLKLRCEFKNIGLAISDLIEYLTGYRIGEYKNYILINDSRRN